MAWVPAAIGAGAELFGGILGNKASGKQARLNREFQERMSNTAHQREVSDLLTAGLNPMLSAMRGNGASTPGGATAQQENPAKGMSSAGSALSLNKLQRDLMKEQITATAAEAANKVSQTRVNEVTAENIAQTMRPHIGQLEASAASLHAGVGKINQEIANLQSQVAEIVARTKGQELSNDQMRELNPLILKAKKLENDRAAALMPEARVRGKAASSAEKGLEAIDAGAKGLGETAAKVVEFYKKGGVPGWLWRKLK